eukprot:1151032-Amphidinium_carterae.1
MQSCQHMAAASQPWESRAVLLISKLRHVQYNQVRIASPFVSILALVLMLVDLYEIPQVAWAVES